MRMLPVLKTQIKFSIIIFFIVRWTATGDHIDFKGNVDLFSGYESNIFREPDIMEYRLSQGIGSFDPVNHDITYGGDARFRLDISPSRKNRITFGIDGDCELFPKYPSANGAEAEGSLEYRYKSKRSSFSLRGDGSFTRRLAMEEGEGNTSSYEYWRYGIEPSIKFSLSKSFSMESLYQLDIYDYRQPLTESSFDNTQQEISVNFVLGKGNRNEFSAEFSYLFKDYRELLSYTYSDSLSKITTLPLRSYSYYTSELQYEHDFGSLEWELSFRLRFRDDMYENFYSYLENKIQSGISAEFKSGTEFDLNGSYRFRKYMVRRAEQPGGDIFNDPELVMSYYDIDADFEQKLWRGLSFFAEYVFSLRRTNTGVLYFRTYRNYLDHLVKAGTKITW